MTTVLDRGSKLKIKARDDNFRRWEFIRNTMTLISREDAEETFGKLECTGISESYLRAWNILEEVKLMLVDNLPPEYILSLIAYMEADDVISPPVEFVPDPPDVDPLNRVVHGDGLMKGEDGWYEVTCAKCSKNISATASSPATFAQYLFTNGWLRHSGIWYCRDHDVNFMLGVSRTDSGR